MCFFLVPVCPDAPSESDSCTLDDQLCEYGPYQLCCGKEYATTACSCNSGVIECEEIALDCAEVAGCECGENIDFMCGDGFECMGDDSYECANSASDNPCHCEPSSFGKN